MRLVITREEVLNCAITKWYPIFATAPRCTIRTEFVPLPADFIAYLDQDGVVLPDFPNAKLHACDPRYSKPRSEEEKLDELYAYGTTWEDAGEDTDGHTSGSTSMLSFEQLETAVQQAISKLDGEAFPKLNWSSPQDAAWVFGSLKCRSSGEVLLLLKSSDFVQHDLHRAFDNIEQRGSRESGEVGYVPTLALRKWSGLNPAMEFRCVVYDKAVVAICQRDTRSYYKFLTENSTQSKIESCILQDLFVSRVRESFPNECYTLDVYVDTQYRPWIIDFNPLARFDSLEEESNEQEIQWDDAQSRAIAENPPHELLSWRLLLEHVRNPRGTRFLVVSSEQEASRAGDILSAHRVPYEVVTGTLNAEECAKLDEIFKNDKGGRP